MKYILPAILFFSSCATTRYVEPLLAKHVASFEAYYGVKTDVNVVFERLEEPFAGLCTVGVNSTIKIDTEFYLDYENDDLAIEQLMFHELAHCFFLLDHDDNEFPNGAPKSIMYSYAFGMNYYYHDQRAYYKEELGEKSLRGVKYFEGNSKCQ